VKIEKVSEKSKKKKAILDFILEKDLQLSVNHCIFKWKEYHQVGHH